MSSLETQLQTMDYFKKKICVIGGYEIYKDEFQKEVSSNSLPIENKQNIGVNISKIDFLYKKNKKFEFLLWNIDCRQPRAHLRTIFYNGAEAIIVFISETKVDQIIQYFSEVQGRLPSATLIFCIILEKFTKDEIFNRYFENEDFDSIIKTNDIHFDEISESSDILKQICSVFFDRTKNKELDTNYIIDFIPITLLFEHFDITDECNDYFEPETHTMNTNKLINTEQLVNYILKLDLDVYVESRNWLKVKNKKLGTFSIYLKNGNVYYFPKICEKCKDNKCMKFKKAPFFICIEPGESIGWTNINGFDQNELLILTKIVALKEGNENNLPRSLLKQITNINRCEKFKK
jgi:hypothetical protein